MKTVVATYLVWMKDTMKSGKPFPNIALLLVGNEENGEAEVWGTPHVLKALGDRGSPLSHRSLLRVNGLAKKAMNSSAKFAWRTAV